MPIAVVGVVPSSLDVYQHVALASPSLTWAPSAPRSRARRRVPSCCSRIAKHLRPRAGGRRRRPRCISHVRAGQRVVKADPDVLDRRGYRRWLRRRAPSPWQVIFTVTPTWIVRRSPGHCNVSPTMSRHPCRLEIHGRRRHERVVAAAPTRIRRRRGSLPCWPPIAYDVFLVGTDHVLDAGQSSRWHLQISDPRLI